MKKEEGMVRVIAWTKEKGEIYDYVKLSHLKRLIGEGYVIALADKSTVGEVEAIYSLLGIAAVRDGDKKRTLLIE